MHWSKNPKIKKQTIEKIRKSKTGKPVHTKKYKRELSEKMKGNKFNIGRKHTQQWKDMMSERMKGNTFGFKKGNKPWTTGKKLPKYICEKKSKSLKKAYKEGRMEYMKNNWKQASKRWQGKNNPRWSGGKYTNKIGYILTHDNDGNYRQEYRIVAERIIGRKLKRSETIHHINENKSDNRPINLYYFQNDSLHKRHHGLKNKPKLKSNLHTIS